MNLPYREAPPGTTGCSEPPAVPCDDYDHDHDGGDDCDGDDGGGGDGGGDDGGGCGGDVTTSSRPRWFFSLEKALENLVIWRK